MAPAWLTALAWLYLLACFSCAGVITCDIAVNGRRQPMAVMNVVFPVTALYLGPLGLALYWHWGRAAAPAAVPPVTMSPVVMSRAGAGHAGRVPGQSRPGTAAPAGPGAGHEPGPPGGRARPWWVTIALEVSHCGSGCTLGDVVSELGVFWLGLSIAGLTLGAEYAGDYIFALAFGIIFQYFAIAPMRGLGLKDGLLAAAKADVISLTAFEVGLFGWMAVMTFVLFPAPHHLTPGSPAYWLMMQAGMIIGFLTSWPANIWLVRRGIKVPM